MFRTYAKKTLLGCAFALAAVFANIPTAEAGPYKVRFDPAFGTPFNSENNPLGWGGEAIFSLGTCTRTGFVSNIEGPCAGDLSLSNAIVNLYNANDANRTTLQTLVFDTGGFVTSAGLSAGGADPTFLNSSPFDARPGAIAETIPAGSEMQAWFSLVFVGEAAQLIWFDQDPGSYSSNASRYNSCLGIDPQSPPVNCGKSANPARLVFTDLPEPESYALMFAGLGALALASRRRKRTA
jgi:hypothetical protein